MGGRRCNASILLTDPSRDGAIPEPGAGAGGIFIEPLSSLVAYFAIVALGVIPGVQPPVCLSSRPTVLWASWISQ